MDKLGERYAKVRAEVPASVTLIAVSKVQPLTAIQALYELGHRDFGENYVQELLEKAREFEARGCQRIRWHFIGHLQTNKVKVLLPFVHSIHSVDSLKLAREISKRAEKAIPCFLEVNIDREESKSGFAPEEVPQASAEITKLPHIDLRGLMCIPAPRERAEELSAPFSALRELEKRCRPHTKGALSMGMSEDYSIAITEGATAVRVGTRIFGPRKP